MVSEPPRPKVVTSSSSEIPWKPATIATWPSEIERATRSGTMPVIWARPYAEVVWIPACAPVKACAGTPNSLIAMDRRDIEIRSPAVRRMSISRSGALSVICAAVSRSSSVVSPIAETTTTSLCPAFRVSTMRFATRLIASTSDTDEPPYFCTMSATGGPNCLRLGYLFLSSLKTREYDEY